MSALEISTYEILKEKLGQEEARTLIDYISQKSGITEEKAEKRYTTDDKVKFYVSEAKTEIVRWMFLFWVSQLAAMVGLVLLFLKK
ncbi:MAG: hypothetical protein EAZ70_10660 [Runella slithyformis]|nr:MAG: hypothetical protein EAY79_11215 [Runella slithyformis]TAF25164.1 MAG: hypothetical protein EAZ70_10660 [Runella slithyformis]TAF49912.1 MAG: hypothetical protein EAZ63_00070 [Runella slithyformis]TAF79627.1 MAG: hypothetical protein EAZ50_10745 [Runella slithyformis]TAH10537.1 MAG: hypothetical protein EAZ14_07660 [Runella slithyformis]